MNNQEVETAIQEAYRDLGINQIEPMKVPQSVLINDNITRFQGAEWFTKVRSLKVLVVGCGGIGSWASLFLSRLNLNNLHYIDSDIIDSTNIGGQFFSSNQVGKYKTAALDESLWKFTPTVNSSYSTRRFREGDITGYDVVISCVDNMETRKFIYNSWKDSLSEVLIDGRMAAEEFQVFCLYGSNKYRMNKYESEWLFDDSQAEQTICNYKQTSFVGGIIGGVIANLVVNYAQNLLENTLIKRDLPFITRYNAEQMFFKTEQ